MSTQCNVEIVCLGLVGEFLCISALWLYAKLKRAIGNARMQDDEDFIGALCERENCCVSEKMSYEDCLAEYGDRAEQLSIALMILLVFLTAALINAIFNVQ
jgi:hypothetical protein